MKNDSELIEESDVRVDMTSREGFIKAMDDVIIPNCLENLASGEPVYVGVGEGERPMAIRQIRKYLKMKKMGTSIERVLKVIEEEVYREDEW